MNTEEKRKIALFRYGILAPLISGTNEDGQSIKEFFRDAADKVYTNPRGEDVRVAASTLSRWYYNYNRNGFDALMPVKRWDTGRQRKLDDDIRAQIKYLRQEYPRIPATLIHQKLMDNGTIAKGDVSLSTVTRYVNQLKAEMKYTSNKDMRRYERAHINEVWCGDSSAGPYLKVDGKKKRVYIIALIDDASRYIVGANAFYHDNYVNLMTVIKSAVMRHGKPMMLNFDNGSSYKNKQMDLLAARIGVVLHYNPPYTPTGKAKIERWFRTLKDHWMAGLNMNDYKDLDELRAELGRYIMQYNQTVHSSLNGLSPQDRFFSESHMIKRLTPLQIEQSFLLEYERRVSADNVVIPTGY